MAIVRLELMLAAGMKMDQGPSGVEPVLPAS